MAIHNTGTSGVVFKTGTLGFVFTIWYSLGWYSKYWDSFGWSPILVHLVVLTRLVHTGLYSYMVLSWLAHNTGTLWVGIHNTGTVWVGIHNTGTLWVGIHNTGTLWVGIHNTGTLWVGIHNTGTLWVGLHNTGTLWVGIHNTGLSGWYSHMYVGWSSTTCTLWVGIHNTVHWVGIHILVPGWYQILVLWVYSHTGTVGLVFTILVLPGLYSQLVLLGWYSQLLVQSGLVFHNTGFRLGGVVVFNNTGNTGLVYTTVTLGCIHNTGYSGLDIHKPGTTGWYAHYWHQSGLVFHNTGVGECLWL